MALEDSLLKKNIPGKYTSWDEYKIGERRVSEYDSGSDSQNDDADQFAVEHEQKSVEADVATSTSCCSDDMERHRPGGIKGTLHDYKLDKEENARQQILQDLESQQLFDRATRGVTMMPGELSMSGSAIQSRMRSSSQLQRTDEDSNLTEEEKEEDRYIRNMTKSQEMGMEAQEHLVTPMFGSVEEVDALEYISAIDETNPETYVVVHLYEPFIPACRTLNQHWDVLARSLAHVRFLRLRGSTASKTLDPIGLPSVVIYKDGQLLSNLTPVTNDLPENFKATDVHWLLESCGIPNSNATEQTKIQYRSFIAEKSSDDFDDGYDDVD